jgi:hypothetical protein
MFHKGGQIEVAENIFGAGLDRLGNLPRLGEFAGQFPHLGDEEMVVPRVCYRPVEAREYLGGICGHEAREVFRKHIHAVFIEQLRRREAESQRDWNG